MFVCSVFHFLLFKDSNQGEIIKQYNYKRPDLSLTSKQRVHSKQFCTKWVTDMIQEGWPVVSQNGTLKRQTDYLFMCWSGGCFCPSCHTSISNVRGPHLGCVKMHHVEREKNLSLLAHTEMALSEDPSLALAPAVNSLEPLHEYGPREGKEWASWSCHPPGSVGRRRKAEHVQWAEVGGHVWWRTSESERRKIVRVALFVRV